VIQFEIGIQFQDRFQVLEGFGALGWDAIFEYGQPVVGFAKHLEPFALKGLTLGFQEHQDLFEFGGGAFPIPLGGP
jgi:hypothetical protein